MYAKFMDIISRIFNVLGKFSHLARTLFIDAMLYIALCARSRTALAAENLFLRKQLAFYQERKIKPRRFDNVTRFMLVLLSHGFAWQDALANVTPKTFICISGYRTPDPADCALQCDIPPHCCVDTTAIARSHPLGQLLPFSNP